MGQLWKYRKSEIFEKHLQLQMPITFDIDGHEYSICMQTILLIQEIVINTHISEIVQILMIWHNFENI